MYIFGQFTADLVQGELEKSGNRIRLQEKPFHLLAILLQNPNQIVTRKQLRAELWPANTFVEFDDGLNTAVKKLRAALGDSSEGPRYIETVPRRGYRFIAPVRHDPSPKAAAAEPAVISVPPETTPLPERRRGHLRIWAAAAAAVLAVVGTGLGLHSRYSGMAVQSIAVLPLEDFSSNEEQAFFADGMTDELITDLAQIGTVRVISRASMMRYKGSHKSIPEIASELHVDAVFEGTISRSADRIRLRAQLVRANPEGHIWAETYDRPRGDVIALQAELARDIAKTIRTRLRPQQEAEIAIERKFDPEAHELYLKGRYFWNKRSHDSNTRARYYFEKAIEVDPGYAPAYAGLADAYAFGGTDLPIKEAASKAKALAEKALSIDSHLAEAHATLGLVAPQFGWNWQEADRELKRAIELNPGLATAYQWHAEVCLASAGRFEEAIEEMRKAEQLDPLSPIIVTDVAKMLIYARRYDEAERQLQKALELDPDFLVARGMLIGIYLERGQVGTARGEFRKLRPHLSPVEYAAGMIEMDIKSGQEALARRQMDTLMKLVTREPYDPGLIASRYVLLGDKDNAFRWLQRGCETGSAWIGSLNGDGIWDPLRSDFRFDQIRRCTHLI